MSLSKKWKTHNKQHINIHINIHISNEGHIVEQNEREVDTSNNKKWAIHVKRWYAIKTHNCKRACNVNKRTTWARNINCSQ